MNRKKIIKTTLVAALFFVALGGWLLHARIHPPAKGPVFLIPYIAGLLSVFGLPLLFCFRPTIVLAYIVNGFLAILGTILMTQYSITHFDGALTLTNILVNTLLADIAILWGKFALGKAIFDLEFLKSDTDVGGQGRFFRYPHMGWWWVHLVALTLVYTLGNIFWK